MNEAAIDALIENNPKLAHARAKLESMAPGNYCLHRSWGFGKIVDFDEAQAKIVIDFEEGDKTGHAMGIAFCVDKLEILKPNDILVRSRTEADAVAEMIKKAPADLICEVLAGNEDMAMMSSEIERTLARVIGPVKYKKWWTCDQEGFGKGSPHWCAQ
jgi:transcription elongation factor GreA-like protein